MSYIYFEDDESDNMLAVINDQQMCFHPVYAPDGQFSVKNIFELDSQDKNIIIADNNLVSSICEIAKKRKVKQRAKDAKGCDICYMDKIHSCSCNLWYQPF